MKKYKITHDRSKCLGCGRCTMVCPDNWEIDETDFLAKCKKDIIDEEELDCNKMAEEECPAQCISIILADTDPNTDSSSQL